VGVIDNLEAVLAKGQDSATLRYGLGSAYLQQGQAEKAAAHLLKAVTHDPGYSAAWKLYGKALVELGRSEDARQAFEQGIQVAQDRGDVQAAKEMRVFLKRLKGSKPTGS
jgi:Tfp pilus assembly protein PilF